MTSARSLRRLWATTAAIAGLAVAALAAPTAAFAADGEGEPITSNPTETEDASITVHKYKTPDTATGLPNNGTELDETATAGLTPLAGITFQVQRVEGIDLTTNAGWQDANNLVAAFAATDKTGYPPALTGFPPAPYTLGTAKTESTDGAGEAVFDGLDIGLYLVTEVAYPGDVTPAAPFLVTVPITDPTTRDGWLYNVHVYPKNSVDTITKTVQDAAAYQLGQKVDWTIKGDIPNVASPDAYQIVDNLDSRLDYTSATVKLTGAEAPVLTAGIDYTITPASATTGGPVVTVVFTEDGRAKLAANNTRQVEVVISTTVNAVGDGTILNQAVLYPNGRYLTYVPDEPGTEPGPDDPPLPVTPVVATKWGNVDVLKHAKDSTSTTLAGAEFKVWAEVVDPADATKTIKQPVTIGGESTWTTPAEGTLSISGLRYSAYADGVAVATGDFANGYVKYWLEEVKAPVGYTLLTEQIPFEVDDVDAAIDVSVANVPANAGFTLPLTGGSGLTLLYVVGGLISVSAVLLTINARRRNAAGAR